MQVDFKIIGKRIQEFRTGCNMTQEQLAEATDLSVSYISYVETAKKKPSLSTIIKIADALDITVDMLLTENLPVSRADYQTEIDILMSDCSVLERQMLYELIRSAREILKSNDWILLKKEVDL